MLFFWIAIKNTFTIVGVACTASCTEVFSIQRTLQLLYGIIGWILSGEYGVYSSCAGITSIRSHQLDVMPCRCDLPRAFRFNHSGQSDLDYMIIWTMFIGPITFENFPINAIRIFPSSDWLLGTKLVVANFNTKRNPNMHIITCNNQHLW